jgi:hypothetical protein
MNKDNIRPYAFIIIFLGVAFIFLTRSTASVAEFLIFLFSGMLVGINIYKLLNKEEGKS